MTLGFWRKFETDPNFRTFFTQIWEFTDPQSRAFGPALWSFVGVFSSLVVVCITTGFLQRHSGGVSKWLKVFDIGKNWSTMVNTEKNARMIECLSGIRVFSTLLIMYGHTYVEFGLLNCLKSVIPGPLLPYKT